MIDVRQPADHHTASTLASRLTETNLSLRCTHLVKRPHFCLVNDGNVINKTEKINVANFS